MYEIDSDEFFGLGLTLEQLTTVSSGQKKVFISKDSSTSSLVFRTISNM